MKVIETNQFESLFIALLILTLAFVIAVLLKKMKIFYIVAIAICQTGIIFFSFNAGKEFQKKQQETVFRILRGSER